VQLCDLFDLSLVGRREAVGLEADAGGVGVVSLTFGAVDSRGYRMARALVQRGLSRGDRLCLQLANRIEVIDLFLACLRLGVIFVPINVLYREREVAHIVTDAAPRLVVTTPDQRALIPAGAPVVDIETLAREAAACDPTPLRTTIDGDDAAALVYTSGTTGQAKGAVLTHNNFAANAVNLVTCWRLTSDDRYLAVLPLFHVHGLGNGVCGWLTSGCRMRLVERFEHQRAITWFEDFKPTLFFGVPTVYHRLLEWAPDVARRIGERARLFVCGSAPLPAHMLDAFRERFGHTILERYGMTETLMITSNPYEGERRAGTVGFPLPGVSVRIVDRDGHAVKGDEVGEVQARGPNVFAGYWKREGATVEAFQDGWFRTGDLGDRSADGYITLRGRGTDLIISAGFNIYPREVEDVLLEQPGVREAVVVGAPDERRGAVPIAYVVVGGDNFEEEAVRAACARQLASFKVPRAIVPVESIPRNALGKVQRHLLPAWSGA
jgi:malonyl-CoA/methylmalonyl-CoA synthetase